MSENAFEHFGLKRTKNRELILQSLRKQTHPLTAEELFYTFEKKDINLSTVYRTLNTFEKVGLVHREVNEKKENIYSLIQEEDSHILVCTECHKRIPLEGCPYHEVNEELEKKTGFILRDQNIEIYGVCPDCQKKSRKA